MSIWDKANKIDELQSNIACVKHVLELVAQDLQDPHSGAVWACHDMLKRYTEELELIANDLLGDMDEVRKLRDQIEAFKTKTKTKKK